MKLSVIILCVCVLAAIICVLMGITYYDVSDKLIVFENMTSDLFNRYNVSNEMRDYYNSVVIAPVKNMINFTFLLLAITLILCILILIVEEMMVE